MFERWNRVLSHTQVLAMHHATVSEAHLKRTLRPHRRKCHPNLFSRCLWHLLFHLDCRLDHPSCYPTRCQQIALARQVSCCHLVLEKALGMLRGASLLCCTAGCFLREYPTT